MIATQTKELNEQVLLKKYDKFVDKFLDSISNTDAEKLTQSLQNTELTPEEIVKLMQSYNPNFSV
jgi:hypothetical protein